MAIIDAAPERLVNGIAACQHDPQAGLFAGAGEMEFQPVAEDVGSVLKRSRVDISHDLRAVRIKAESVAVALRDKQIRLFRRRHLKLGHAPAPEPR